LRQIYYSALFLVHLHFEFRQLLAKSLLYRLPKRLLPGMRIHQNHHIVGKSGVLQLNRELAKEVLTLLDKFLGGVN
jgi:hypothetical protein